MHVRVPYACIGALLFSGISWCADPFPLIECENLLGKKVVLPELARGRPAVLVIGFTHASHAQTKVWSARLEPEFVVYSVAVLQDVPRLVRGMAVSGIKKDVPQERRDRFLLVFRGEPELKASVGFERRDDAYLALIDRDGLIRWQFHGAFNESSLRELRARIADLRQAN
jgi:hypothetical protein